MDIHMNVPLDELEQSVVGPFPTRDFVTSGVPGDQVVSALAILSIAVSLKRIADAMDRNVLKMGW